MGLQFSSYEHCSSLPDRLRFTSEQTPDREVMIFYTNQGKERNPYTARQLYQLGGQFAARLRKAGFRKGNVIASTLPNSPERLIVDIGVMMAGCAVMNGQILLSDGEDFFRSLRNARCKAVIVANSSDQSPAWTLLQPYIGDVNANLTSKVTCDRAPELETAIVVTREKGHDYPPLLEDLQKEGDVFHSSDIGSDDLAYIMCTSGSTGFSKLVPRTHGELYEAHRNLIRDVLALCPYFDEETLFYSDRPLGWIAGFPYGQLCMGDKRVLADLWYPRDSKHSGELVWHVLRKENCAVALIQPLETSEILSFLDRNDNPKAKDFRIKVWFTGGQPLIGSQMKKYFKLCENILVGYGSTEVVLASSGLIKESEIDQIQDYFCGKCAAHLDIRIVDKSGHQVPVGESGEIQFKGRGIVCHYFNQLEPESHDQLAHLTKDGWFATSDVGWLDEGEFLYVKGRMNDVIMYGSAVVYPGWLEERILQHPSVQNACVVPVPDPVLYHKICACVQVREGQELNEDGLRAFCDALFLSEGAMTPKPEFFLIFHDDFPQTPTGKPDRRMLKTTAADKFGKQ